MTSNTNTTQEFFSQKNTGGISDEILLEELKGANQNMTKTGPGIPTRSWKVTSLKSEYSTEAASIQRLSDGEVFSIGDYVTNGTQMRGKIQKFDYSFNSDDIFVVTDWSDVGMNLDSLRHCSFQLPSEHQIGDSVTLGFGTDMTLPYCKVIKVHFSENKILYDIEVSGYSLVDGKGDNWTTRLYNVDSAFITKPIKNAHTN